MTLGKNLIKKKCKACGNVIICAKAEHGNTPSPESCATCRTLGVEKAIEQRLMASRKSDKTQFEISKGSSQIGREKDRRVIH